MDKKIFKGTIKYLVERIDKIIFFKYKRYYKMEIEYPNLVLAYNQEIAKNLIKLSKFWKGNKIHDKEYSKDIVYDVIEKDITIEEVNDKSLLYYMNGLTDKDFMIYIDQLISGCGE